MSVKMTVQEKAKQLRYKKSALATLQFDGIKDELYEISSECTNIAYAYCDDDETLLDALDGDEDEANEFKMMFADLSGKCDSLYNALEDNYVTEHFDDLLVGVVGDRYKVIGFDMMEEDYFGMTSYEEGLAKTEAGKRLMRLTKEQLLSITGQTLGVSMSFLDVRHSYDCLKASFDILKGDNVATMNAIKEIESLYKKASTEQSWEDNARKFDNLTGMLPEIMWVE